MAWMRIGELAEENPSSTIVVDTAPTGHTLRMLGAAEHFRQFAAALDAMQEKHRDMVRQFTRRSVRDAVDVFIDDFEATARRRRELLVSSGAFIPVFLSEPWVVEQTKRLIASVEVPVPFAVLNRAAFPDCERDRARMKRDDAARAALAPLRVVDAPRACVPLDSVERIAQWSN
jgi:arsenite-transporting ATPase